MIDLTDRVVGMLTVIRFDEARSRPGGSRWVCECECGNRVSHLGHSIRKAIVFSCGCKRRPNGTSTDGTSTEKRKSHYDKLRWGASTQHLDRLLRISWGKVRIDPREAA